MTRIFEQLKNNLQKFRLSEGEKLEARRRLGDFMRMRPVRKDVFVRQLEQRSSSFFSSLLLIKERRYGMTGLIVAVIILLTGGTAVSAEGALPGDALYPVKVNVNERVLASLAFSQEAKADLNVALAQKRLEEAEKLAVKGELSADVRARLEERFALFAERAEARIETLRENGRLDAADRVSASMETALAAHERILAGIEGRSAAEVRELLSELKLRMNAAARHSAEVRAKVSDEAGDADAEVRVRAESAARGRIGAAGNKISEVEGFMARAEGRADAEVIAEAQVRLDEAVSVLADAQASFEGAAFGEAFVQAGEAHRMAQQAKLMIFAHQELNINVNLRNIDEDADATAGVEAKAEVEAEAETETNSEGGIRVPLERATEQLKSRLGL